MNKAEAMETIEEYEQDFEAIEGILSDDSLTPSEKCQEISDIVIQDGGLESEPEEGEEA